MSKRNKPPIKIVGEDQQPLQHEYGEDGIHWVAKCPLCKVLAAQLPKEPSSGALAATAPAC